MNKIYSKVNHPLVFTLVLIIMLATYVFINGSLSIGQLSSDVWGYQFLEMQERFGYWHWCVYRVLKKITLFCRMKAHLPLTIGNVNQQIQYYFLLQIDRMAVPTMICTVAGFVVGYRAYRRLWLTSLVYFLPFALFEFLRPVYIDLGHYYVFLDPAGSVMSAVFLVAIYGRLRAKTQFADWRGGWLGTLPSARQAVFTLGMGLWLIFSPTPLTDRSAELPSHRESVDYVSEFYEFLRNQERPLIVILPDRTGVGELLWGGKSGGGNLFELMSECTAIYRRSSGTGMTEFTRLDDTLEGWKFGWCQVQATNAWLVAKIRAGALVLTFSDRILENSNLEPSLFRFRNGILLKTDDGKEYLTYMLELSQ